MQLHTPLDELYNIHPDLAARLQSLSSILEHQDHDFQSEPSIDHHAKAIEREELLKEIHKQPGFENFLLPRPFAQLLPAANQGPIVMLNVSRIHCDALVLVSGSSNILHVSLDNLTLAMVMAWHELFQLVKTKGSVSLNDFPSRKALRLPDQPEKIMSIQDVLTYILRDLWSGVIHPILKALEINVSFCCKFCISLNFIHRNP